MGLLRPSSSRTANIQVIPFMREAQHFLTSGPASQSYLLLGILSCRVSIVWRSRYPPHTSSAAQEYSRTLPGYTVRAYTTNHTPGHTGPNDPAPPPKGLQPCCGSLRFQTDRIERDCRRPS